MDKKKKIYALYGAHDTGKTTTLRALGQRMAAVAKPSRAIPASGDFATQFVIKGVRVAIISAGDSKMQITKGLDALNTDGDFDILFCAARTRGQTTDFLSSYFKGQTLRWIHHLYIEGNEQDKVRACNESVASFLYEILLLDLQME